MDSKYFAVGYFATGYWHPNWWSGEVAAVIVAGAVRIIGSSFRKIIGG